MLCFICVLEDMDEGQCMVNGNHRRFCLPVINSVRARRIPRIGFCAARGISGAPRPELLFFVAPQPTMANTLRLVSNQHRRAQPRYPNIRIDSSNNI